jgi:transketolase
MPNSTVNELKKRIVIAAYRAGEGHLASAFSILDILYVLYNQVLKPEDYFVLSKGHASLALYAVLADKGVIPREWLDHFTEYNSPLGGHPDRNKIPGVVFSTGSLGHGLPQAVGLALALKVQKKPGRVYCLIGDGECNEGAIWEALLLAYEHELTNLVVIVDNNHSNDRALNLRFLPDKFRTFGYFTIFIPGHEHSKIAAACFTYDCDYPIAIIAETLKGKGCKRMEDNPEWHHKTPNRSELNEILAELDNFENSANGVV